MLHSTSVEIKFSFFLKVCSRFSLERKEVNVKTLLSIKFVWNLEISVRIGKSCLKQNF